MIFGDTLYTPRLMLRRVTEDDLPTFLEWSGSKTANGAYLTPENISYEQGLDAVRNGIYWSHGNRIFMIADRENRLIGTIHFWLRSEKMDCAVIALKISEPDLRNQGYGTEAQKYLTIWLFERMKLASVEMYTDINNHPQQRCLEKLGFLQVETLNYDDHQVNRLGYLYRLDKQRFADIPIYRYHYEE